LIALLSALASALILPIPLRVVVLIGILGLTALTLALVALILGALVLALTAVLVFRLIHYNSPFSVRDWYTDDRSFQFLWSTRALWCSAFARGVGPLCGAL
jgi:hypothetical protein